MEQRIAELDAIIAQYNLNKHPFYQEWRAGTLPTEKLRAYGAQYAHFVGTIDEGWETLGEEAYAREERVHELLWSQFQAEVGAGDFPPEPSTDTLVRAARNAFRTVPEAVGALYSFEAQQPSTSRSKLDGLREHYELTWRGQEYFRVHADDFAEAESLRARATQLSDAEFARAKSACSVVCAAMWQALDSLYYN